MKAPDEGIHQRNDQGGVIEEFLTDALDSALDSEGIKEETEKKIEKVLTAIAGETESQLPQAARKERVKQTAQAAHQEEAFAEGADDEEELEEIRARLGRVRS